MAINVLFVCLGNICRSPTAHGIFEGYIKTRGLENLVSVDSAGTAKWHIGSPPDERSIAAALERGYDLSHLRARQATAQDFDSFDYVLAMDATNLDDLRRMCPQNFAGELDLFLNYIESSLGQVSEPRETNVPDPYFGGDEGFQHVVSLIEQASEGLVQHIIQKHELAV